jgi:RHS repeat-associated protein
MGEYTGNNPHNLQQLIRLPGQQWDKETGLYYNRHRYLDPQQGKYITLDPIGLRSPRKTMVMVRL